MKAAGFDASRIGMSADEISVGNTVGVMGTIIIRLIIGPVSDQIGVRLSYSFLLLFSCIPGFLICGAVPPARRPSAREAPRPARRRSCSRDPSRAPSFPRRPRLRRPPPGRVRRPPPSPRRRPADGGRRRAQWCRRATWRPLTRCNVSM
jgi:hypothetical protein